MSPVQPTPTNINEVAINVAIVIPEIGFEDEPIKPTILEETVTKKNPNTTIIIAESKFVGMFGIAAIKITSTTLPIKTYPTIDSSTIFSSLSSIILCKRKEFHSSTLLCILMNDCLFKILEGGRTTERNSRVWRY